MTTSAPDHPSEDFLRSIVPPEEDRRAYTSAPATGFRWFRSPNVVDLECELRRRRLGDKPDEPKSAA
jgi:hypothetical protein